MDEKDLIYLSRRIDELEKDMALYIKRGTPYDNNSRYICETQLFILRWIAKQEASNG